MRTFFAAAALCLAFAAPAFGQSNSSKGTGGASVKATLVALEKGEWLNMLY